MSRQVHYSTDLIIGVAVPVGIPVFNTENAASFREYSYVKHLEVKLYKMGKVLVLRKNAEFTNFD